MNEKVTLRDYDFERPMLELTVEASGGGAPVLDLRQVIYSANTVAEADRTPAVWGI